uniref:30S ribosomal protein S9 n=1 Tax=Scytothamnus australis TaxID=66621 RepID=UPI002E7AA864|nr:30S ribosomal protein S9 [Scytothamnus australis]WAM64684.1 30S ribosomal protein S9 [Scytothamnus australis]
MKTKTQINSHISAIGRKKESTAIISLIPVSEATTQLIFEINGQKAEQYFQQNFTYLTQISLPLRKIKLEKKYKIIAKVRGGGLTGQADSIKLGIARALCKLDSVNFRPTLKFEGLLKRDARVKERRKYGLKKARKASQYSKR